MLRSALDAFTTGRPVAREIIRNDRAINDLYNHTFRGDRNDGQRTRKSTRDARLLFVAKHLEQVET